MKTTAPNEATAQQLKEQLRRFNRGVRDVTIEYGVICIHTSSKRAAYGVQLDMLRSRSCRSVTITENNIAGGFTVHAIPA